MADSSRGEQFSALARPETPTAHPRAGFRGHAPGVPDFCPACSTRLPQSKNPIPSGLLPPAAAEPINTFVENVDLDGKKVIPFATSGGSGMGKTLANLKPSCPGANWVEGKVINGMSEKALADWAEKL